ncbi:MAG: hypothetical protein ACI35W_00045 [Anaeroplasmataceae bacterium]
MSALNKMSINEAKEFFIKYHGFEFHMSREEPNKYKDFLASKLNKNLLEEWKHEILDEDLKKIYNHIEKNNLLIIICDFIELYKSTKTKLNEYANKLFELIDYAEKYLDSKQKILIMEELAGRNTILTDSVIKFICDKTSLKDKLILHIYRLINFEADFILEEAGWDNPKNRYLNALENINKALK